jgi:hypothetical protein
MVPPVPQPEATKRNCVSLTGAMVTAVPSQRWQGSLAMGPPSINPSYHKAIALRNQARIERRGRRRQNKVFFNLEENFYLTNELIGQ